MPESDMGKLCRQILLKYDDIHQKHILNVKIVTKEYIQGLTVAPSLGSNDVVYQSAYDSNCKNDMSLLRLFRSEGFNVLSLGDCESVAFADRLSTYSTIKEEVDVLICLITALIMVLSLKHF